MDRRRGLRFFVSHATAGCAQRPMLAIPAIAGAMFVPAGSWAAWGDADAAGHEGVLFSTSGRPERPPPGCRATVILSAYLALSMGWVKAGRRFQTANLLGACAFIINGAFHEAGPSVVTNIVWFLISAVALLRMRSAGQPPEAAVDILTVQFPGVPDTTGHLAVVEALTGSVHRDVDGQRPLG